MVRNAQAIKAGEAFVRIFADNRDLVRGLRGAQRSVQRFGAGIQNIGQSLLLGAGAIGAPLIKSIKDAGDAAEGLSKFRAIFKEQSVAAEAFAKTLSQSVGRSINTIRDNLSSARGLFTGLGEVEAREMSQRVTRLALDFASFNNLSDTDAVDRFIAGIGGSGEVLERFGVDIKQASLNAELLASGVVKSARAATELQKKVARLDIIERTMGQQGAIGDAIRTSGSFNNQLKALSAGLQDVSVAIGSALIDSATESVGSMRDATDAAVRWIKANEDLVQSLGKLTATAFIAGTALVGIGVVLRTIAGALGVIAKSAKLLSVSSATVSAFVGGIGTLAGLAPALLGVGVAIGKMTSGIIAMARQQSKLDSANKRLDKMSVAAGKLAETTKDLASSGAAGELTLAEQFAKASTGDAEALKKLTTDLQDEIEELARAQKEAFSATPTLAQRALSRITGAEDPVLAQEATLAKLEQQARAVTRKIRTEYAKIQEATEQANQEATRAAPVQIDEKVAELKKRIQEIEKSNEQERIDKLAKLAIDLKNIDLGEEASRLVGGLKGVFSGAVDVAKEVAGAPIRAIAEAAGDFREASRSIGQFGGAGVEQALGGFAGLEPEIKRQTRIQEAQKKVLEKIEDNTKKKNGVGLAFVND